MAKVIITGIAGCIGTWIAKHLLDEEHEVVGIDIADRSENAERLGIKGRYRHHSLDIRDNESFAKLLGEEAPDGVIHLVSLLMPACKANPLLCVDINVKSFMTVLEQAREQKFNVAYASSAWVLNATDDRLITESDKPDPQSLYGVFKLANEGMSSIYAKDYGVNTNGLRPYIVYGPGREGGLTADINLSLLSAAKGAPYHIGFGGKVALHHASDVAKQFVRLALEPKAKGKVYNVRGTVVGMQEVVDAINTATGTEGLVTFKDTPLPIAANLSDDLLQQDYGPLSFMTLEQGFRETLRIYEKAGELS